jgi:hypothetical protein
VIHSKCLCLEHIKVTLGGGTEIFTQHTKITEHSILLFVWVCLVFFGTKVPSFTQRKLDYIYCLSYSSNADMNYCKINMPTNYLINCSLRVLITGLTLDAVRLWNKVKELVSFYRGFGIPSWQSANKIHDAGYRVWIDRREQLSCYFTTACFVI